MNYEQMDLARQLARVPRNAPERCLLLDHDWSAWGPYEPARSEAYWFGHWTAADGLEPIKAWRLRGCPRCGCEQAENYDGTVRKIVADPSGIEKRIKRHGS